MDYTPGIEEPKNMRFTVKDPDGVIFLSWFQHTNPTADFFSRRVYYFLDKLCGGE